MGLFGDVPGAGIGSVGILPRVKTGTRGAAELSGYPRNFQLEKPRGISVRPLNIVTLGPSISNYGFMTATSGTRQGYPGLSEIGHALQFFGPGIIQKYIGGAVTGKTDNFGNFGWSGKRCDEMTAELLLSWIPQLQTANYVPDIIMLTGILVNDLWAGGVVATPTQLKTRFDELLRVLNTSFPSVRIVCGTPHLRNDAAPNASANYIASFDYARDYTLDLDNDSNFAAVDLSSLSYALTKYYPKDGYTWGITQGSLSSPNPDLGVHPNVTACSINGRAYSIGMSRIAPTNSLRIPTLKSTNLTLSGSGALTGTGNSGTAPANAVQATTLVGATCVGVAGNPGPWTVTLTADVQNPTGVAQLENGIFTLRLNTSANLPLPAAQVQMWGKVEIISGAENIAMLNGVMTVSGTLSLSGVHSTFSDQYAFPASYQNGDIIYLMTPEGLAAGGTPTTMYHDVVVRLYIPNSPVVLKIHESGWRETDTRIPITVGASPFTYINNSKRPQQCFISGGTVTSIQFSRDGGTTLDTVTAGPIVLQVNDRFVINHTGAPTAIAYPQ